MKGDRVEIVVDAGDTTRTYEIVARRAGRRVEVSVARGVVTVTEVTRTGTPVRAARFLSNRVIALVEHPVDRPDTADATPPGPSGRPPAGPPGPSGGPPAGPPSPRPGT